MKPGLVGFAEDLIYKAYLDGYMIGSPTELLVRWVNSGKRSWVNLPERCKPGGLLKTLKDDEKKLLSCLRAEHFNHRQK